MHKRIAILILIAALSVSWTGAALARTAHFPPKPPVCLSLTSHVPPACQR